MAIVSSILRIYSDSACQTLVTSVAGTTAATQNITVTGLSPITQYYAKMFATDSNGLTGESLVQSFTTSAVTYTFSNIFVAYENDYNQLEVGVDVAGPTGTHFTECGVIFATDSHFTSGIISDSNTSGAANFFSGDVSGFSENTTYYYKFFAVSTEYGRQEYIPPQNTITTHYAEPVLSVSVSNITDTSAVYTINYSGNYPPTNLSLAIAESGGQWQDIQIENMSGTQTALIPYTLTPNTTYDLEFSCNYYSGNPTESCSFTTLAARPTVTITSVSDVTPNGATVNISIS